MAYKQRSIRLEVINTNSTFDESGNNTISISNAKVHVSLQASVGLRAGTTANVNIAGLGLELIALLSFKAQGNYSEAIPGHLQLKVYVPDDTGQEIGSGSRQSEVELFSGYMNTAIANMNATPDPVLTITATGNTDLQHTSAPPYSHRGSTPVADIITAICDSVGYTAKLVGLDGKVLVDPHFEGDVYEQLMQVCKVSGLQLDVTPPTITVWPEGTTKDDIVPLVSPEHGMIGYPIFSNGGIMFQTQFSSLLAVGRLVKIQTSLPHASGIYSMTSVQHELSTWDTGGVWNSIVTAYKPANAPAESNVKANATNP